MYGATKLKLKLTSDHGVLGVCGAGGFEPPGPLLGRERLCPNFGTSRCPALYTLSFLFITVVLEGVLNRRAPVVDIRSRLGTVKVHLRTFELPLREELSWEFE